MYGIVVWYWCELIYFFVVFFGIGFFIDVVYGYGECGVGFVVDGVKVYGVGCKLFYD